MKKHLFFVGKLVRDKVPDIERDLGISPCERIMEMDEYKERLKDKLIEEANEVIESTNDQELLVELADLMEVMYAIASTANLTIQDIENKRLAKKLERGGFENRIFNAHTYVKADHPELKFFRANAHKYPEIEESKKA